MKTLKKGTCYWRFKGHNTYHYGYVTFVGYGLVRMGLWIGDRSRGPVVDPHDIDFKQ